MDDAPAVPPTGTPQWQVIVEHAQRGMGRPPTAVHVFPQLYATAPEALQAAEQRAFEFEPPEPSRPQGRRVFADADGFLTVMVKGSELGGHHFSTRVVQVVQRPLS